MKTLSRVAVTATASVMLVLTGCANGGGGATDIDLGDGPPVAGTVKENALTGIRMGFAAYGGVNQDAQMEYGVQPFAEMSGAEVASDGPVDYAKIQAQVQSKNVTWDVVQTDINWAASQCGEDGLFEDIDTDIVDLSNVPAGLYGDCFVPAFQYAHVLMFNTDKLGAPPTDGWDAFFDVEAYPGKRAIYGDTLAQPGVFEGALIADGVAPDDLYPLDFERALRKLDTIKDHLIYWSTGAENTQIMQSQEASIVLSWSGRSHEASTLGLPYEPVWENAVRLTDVISVPKNTKSPKAAQALLNYYLGAEPQARISEQTSFSPVNTTAEPQLDEIGMKYLTTRPEIADKLITPDAGWWAANYATIAPLWQEWLQQS